MQDEVQDFNGVPSGDAMMQYQTAIVHAREHVAIAEEVAGPIATCYSATVLALAAVLIARRVTTAMAQRNSTVREAAQAIMSAREEGGGSGGYRG